MRLTNFVQGTLARTASAEANHRNMRLFSSPDFLDGWEIWLQCQAFADLPETGAYMYRRGVNYPTSNEKCDFQIRRTAREGITLWIELKVLLRDDARSLVDRFASDIQKIQGLQLPEETNSIGAIAVVPLRAERLFEADLKRRFIGKAPKGFDLSKVAFEALLPGAAPVRGNWQQHVGPGAFDEDCVVVLSYMLY